MSLIFYYSNYCNNCAGMVQRLSRSQNKNDIHFLCIDNRIKKPDGATYIILSNGQEMILPTTVDKVPALLLLNRGNQVLFGQQILQHLQPVQSGVTERLQNREPDAFSFNDMNSSGVSSDNYSFLDQSIEALSAKGDGGLRQLRNNVRLEYMDNIETPPDDYVPNKVGEVSLDKLQQDRQNALSNKR